MQEKWLSGGKILDKNEQPYGCQRHRNPLILMINWVDWTNPSVFCVENWKPVSDYADAGERSLSLVHQEVQLQTPGLRQPTSQRYTPTVQTHLCLYETYAFFSEIDLLSQPEEEVPQQHSTNKSMI
jgi:hypothetical protein